ncbi:unnamed protein product [Zymoseptoria tritici ST99CH_3D1]|nr:unnamed protein product [Zymoseptoria tritici ST99CH_3D1]
MVIHQHRTTQLAVIELLGRDDYLRSLLATRDEEIEDLRQQHAAELAAARLRLVLLSLVVLIATEESSRHGGLAQSQYHTSQLAIWELLRTDEALRSAVSTMKESTKEQIGALGQRFSSLEGQMSKICEQRDAYQKALEKVVPFLEKLNAERTNPAQKRKL